MNTEKAQELLERMRSILATLEVEILDEEDDEEEDEDDEDEEEDDPEVTA